MAATGLISTDADIDVFRVEATAGAATFTVTPAMVSPNLDVLLEVRNGAGSVIASADAPSSSVDYDTVTGLSASLSTSIPADGTYFVLVAGVGAGTLATGYSGYGSLGAYRLTGTLVEGARTVSVVDPPPVVEGPAGVATTSDFEVTLSSPSPEVVTVVAATAGGTANAGTDYTARSATLTFAPGVTSVPFPVSVLGDDTAELAETVVVELSNPSSTMLGDAQGVGTIANDDYGVSIADAPAGSRVRRAPIPPPCSRSPCPRRPRPQ